MCVLHVCVCVSHREVQVKPTPGGCRWTQGSALLGRAGRFHSFQQPPHTAPAPPSTPAPPSHPLLHTQTPLLCSNAQLRSHRLPAHIPHSSPIHQLPTHCPQPASPAPPALPPRSCAPSAPPWGLWSCCSGRMRPSRRTCGKSTTGRRVHCVCLGGGVDSDWIGRGCMWTILWCVEFY